MGSLTGPGNFHPKDTKQELIEWISSRIPKESYKSLILLKYNELKTMKAQLQALENKGI